MNRKHVLTVCTLLIAVATPGHADIFRWDNGELIPGTEGITPGPGVQLSNRQLHYARLTATHLTGANFASSDLTNSWFHGSRLEDSNLTDAILAGATFRGTNLVNANLSGADLTDAALEANLTNANLSGADLTRAGLSDATFQRANLTGAIVKGASLGEASGLVPEQLYSTASYQSKDLQGIQFSQSDLSGWDFSGQNLTDASFFQCSLANANLRGANLTNVNLTLSTVTDANFQGTVITGADLENITSSGFTKDQFYSTASYQAKDLRKIRLFGNDLSGWDFRGQDLGDASLQNSNLTNARLTGAVVTGTSFAGTIARGFTKEQLYLTASYQAKDLQGIRFFQDDLSGWNFSEQNLTGASLWGTLTDADFTDAIVAGAYFYGTISEEQFYSTRSYQTRDLQGVALGGIGVWFNFRTNLAGWDFNAQDLSNAYLSYSSMAGADLRGANLSGASMHSVDLTGADTRGALGLNLTEATTRNTIHVSGSIFSLVLGQDERLLVRDEDGVPSLPPDDWRNPRPPIPVKVFDNLAMAGGSTLALRFEEDPWDSLISFEPGIPVTLGGVLELTFADDVNVAEQVGRTLKLFDWTGVSPTGQFEIQSLYDWDTTKLYTTGQVTLRAIPEPTSFLLATVALATPFTCRHVRHHHSRSSHREVS